MPNTSNEPKLRLAIAKSYDTNSGNKIIRSYISEENLIKLDELSEKTGFPMMQLSSKMIEFALDHVELVEL